jgi:hypothetical protein
MRRGLFYFLLMHIYIRIGYTNYLSETYKESHR